MSHYEKALYAKDQHGNIREWRIKAIVNNDRGDILISHGVIDGQKNDSFEEILEGLAGRSIEEQTLSRFNSRINKKIDSGYVENIEDALNHKRVNSLGLSKAMLAAKYKNMAHQIPFEKGVHIQRKYNGHRCLIINNNGTLIPYSRNGKIISAIDHILDDIEIPNGTTLDGELYCHGEKFQTISSWVKRKQPETKKITYMVYDVISTEVFSKRLQMLKEFDCLFNTKSLQLAQTNMVYSEQSAKAELAQYIREGYEGAIIRLSNLPYQDGKRSKSLIKMKEFLDDEFMVVDISPSSEGWGILTCLAKNGKRFHVSAPGSKYEKEQILLKKDEYIGRMVNIEYAELTESGIPFHPTANFFRDKGSE